MKNTAAGVPFILICVLLDILGIGLIIPVLPQLVGDLAGSQSAQAWWLGAMLVAYGLMQFCFAPTLGALSDRYGRRPVLLLGIFGLGIMFLVPALSQSLPVILFSRILGGMFAGNIAVAQAYISDVTDKAHRRLRQTRGLLRHRFHSRSCPRRNTRRKRRSSAVLYRRLSLSAQFSLRDFCPS